MRQTKRIILAGHAGSGKDYLAAHFVEQGFIKDVSLTTREPREGEEEGFHYHYVDEETFDARVATGDFYETTIHNGWKYGTLQASWDVSDVFIMNPDGISTIKPEDRGNCIVVYIEIPEDIRRERMALRRGADDTERRIAVDKKMFKGFTDYDFRINDPNFNTSTWIDLLVKAANSEVSVEELTDTEG